MKTRHYQQVLACLIAFWAVFVVGCSSKTEQPDPNKSQAPAGITSDQNDAQPTQPGQAAQSDKNDVAVTVNGVEITEGQIEALIEPMLKTDNGARTAIATSVFAAVSGATERIGAG